MTWLPADLAALYADVKPATLRVWRLRYDLTTRRVNGTTYYDLAELAEVIRRRTAGDDPTSS